MTDVATQLAGQEQIIERGLKSFMEVGVALMKIRDEKLYREGYSTFEDYCVDRWQISRPRAYQLMSSADAVSNFVDMLPTKEAHARELAKAPEDMRRDIWQAALDQNEGKPTAQQIAALVTEALSDREADEEEAEATAEVRKNLETVGMKGADRNSESFGGSVPDDLPPPPPPVEKLDPEKVAKRIKVLAHEFIRDINRLSRKDYTSADTAWNEAAAACDAVVAEVQKRAGTFEAVR